MRVYFDSRIGIAFKLFHYIARPKPSFTELLFVQLAQYIALQVSKNVMRQIAETVTEPLSYTFPIKCFSECYNTFFMYCVL